MNLLLEYYYCQYFVYILSTHQIKVDLIQLGAGNENIYDMFEGSKTKYLILDINLGFLYEILTQN